MTSSQARTIAAIVRHPITHAIGMMTTSAAFLVGCSGIQLSAGSPAIADDGSGTAGSAASVKDICSIVSPAATIAAADVAKLEFIGKGNSTNAMRRITGLPYCYVGTTEYFPVATDRSTWIGIMYDGSGTYQGYTFSANNGGQP